MDIYYRIGYAIFLLPCQIILTKVKPRWWLPSNELAWGVMTGTGRFSFPPAEACSDACCTSTLYSFDGRSERRPGDVRVALLHRCFRGQFISRNHFDLVQLVVSLGFR